VQAQAHTPLRLVIGKAVDDQILNKKNPADWLGFLFKSLAMTYSHMGKPHTTIGDASFHF
jgi:hypothetical protein